MKPSLGQSQASKLQRVRQRKTFIKCQSVLLYNSTITKTRSITEDLQSTASSKLITAAGSRNFLYKYTYNKCHLQMQEILPESLSFTRARIPKQ